MSLRGTGHANSSRPLAHHVIWQRGVDVGTLVSRLVALLFVVPATYYFIYWLPFSLVPLGEYRWIASLVSLLCALGVGRYVWVELSTSHHGAISSILMGAVILGGIGFTAGFFGPLIFMPNANQGPLLGIFITGPFGFIGGGILGFLYWAIRGRKGGSNVEKQNVI